MKRLGLIGTAVVAVVVAVVLIVFWPFGRRASSMILPGIVEIQEVRLGSKIGGRVAAVHVREGIVVEAGTALVTFEAPELEKQILQQQARVAQLEQDWKKAEKGPRDEEIAAARAAEGAAKARWERMEAGFREEEKRQAKSELQSAEGDLKQAAEEFERVKGLYPQASSKSDLDLALGLRDRMRGRFNAAKAKYEMMQAGNRTEDKVMARQEWDQAQANLKLLVEGTRIEDKLAAKARFEEARARLEEMEVNFKERTIYCPEKAVIEVIAVRPGDLVAANQCVVRVLRAQDLWLKVYVPETEVSKVSLGTKVEVRIDAYPDRVFEGTVIQVASISEFTPRNVQSIDERRHQVFAVKVQVENPRGVFKSGLAAEVVLPLEGPP
jgi:multidrug resistance efflux pump